MKKKKKNLPIHTIYQRMKLIFSIENSYVMTKRDMKIKLTRENKKEFFFLTMVQSDDKLYKVLDIERVH